MQFETVENKLDANRALYVRAAAGRIEVAPELSVLVRDPRENLCEEVLLANLKGNAQTSTRTLWKNIACIPPGFRLTVTWSKAEPVFAAENLFAKCLATYRERDVMTALHEYVCQHATSGRRAVICLSGGRDSTALAHVVHRALPRASAAVTWRYRQGASHDDELAASTQAANLGIPHVPFNLEPSSIYAEPSGEALRPTISTSTTFYESMRRMISTCVATFGQGTILFNGHGGDHLYLDPPPYEAIPSLIKQGKLSKAWHTAQALRTLTGQSFFQAHLNNRAAKANSARLWSQTLSYKHATAQQEEKRISLTEVKRIHQQRIMEAVYQNSTSEQGLADHLRYPFTDPSTIACVWDAPCEALFDASRTRIPFQESFNRYTGSSALLRRDKGDVTGVFQSALAQKFDWLRHLIANGTLARRGLIKPDAIVRIMERNSLGIGGIEPLLNRIIAFELMVSR